jgi:hypothetical protein
MGCAMREVSMLVALVMSLCFWLSKLVKYHFAIDLEAIK